MESPRETAERLAANALKYSPKAFEEIFERTLAATEDLEIHSRLMCVAGMYLDRHPGAFRLPRPLAERLLKSEDYDQLLAGLKAIQHCGASLSEMIAHFLAAMKRNDWEERYASLYQLNNLLRDASSSLAEADAAVLEELQPVLTQIASHAPAAHVRDCAVSCHEIVKQRLA
jgi:hypothetical protein